MDSNDRLRHLINAQRSIAVALRHIVEVESAMNVAAAVHEALNELFPLAQELDLEAALAGALLGVQAAPSAVPVPLPSPAPSGPSPAQPVRLAVASAIPAFVAPEKAGPVNAPAPARALRPASIKPKGPYTVIRTWPSSSTPGKNYELREGGDGVVYCTCPAWAFSKDDPKECKHMREWMERAATGLARTFVPGGVR